MRYLRKKTIYISTIILLLVLIHIKKRNKKYGYKNIEPFELKCDEDKTNTNKDFTKKDADEEYIRIIKCDTQRLKKRLNDLHKYYIYKLLETIFLKKTEINVLLLLVKNKFKCDNYCIIDTKKNISLIIKQVNNLENIINNIELENKNEFINKQLECIRNNNSNAKQKCIDIINSYNNNEKNEDEIKKECIDEYGIENELCKKPANEISFNMSKNKCIESHKISEKTCIEIPEEIEFMTQPNISKYIKDLEEQIKNQEPKLNRFLCYKCIKRVKDGKDELNENDNEECKNVCKDIVEEIQKKSKEDYLKQKKLFLEQQKKMNEYYEKQYKQNNGITSKTLKKIFNGEIAETNPEFDYLNDIYNNIDINKHKISEINFNNLFNKLNTKVIKNIKLNELDLKDLEIIFNSNYTIKYKGYLSQFLTVLRNKNILIYLKNYIVKNKEEKIYESQSDENRDILSQTGYDEQTQSDIKTKEFNIPNLPEFYDLTKIQKDLSVSYTDLQGSPLPMTDNIYNSKFQSFSFN